MKIAIVLGCLEPRKNGVADYSFVLANQLQELGHEIMLVSINDPYIDKLTRFNYEVLTIPKIRISDSLSDLERKEIITNHINLFSPDIVSIQFVSYSFHKKGIPCNLANLFSGIINLNAHIHFHELWIEEGKLWNIKNILLGLVQKLTIYKFIKSINPFSITTSIPYFSQMLFSLNNVEILPLFGNILKEEFSCNQLLIDTSKFTIVVFGNLTTKINELENQLIRLKNLVERENLEISIKFIGNIKTYKTKSYSLFVKYFGNECIQHYGECSNQTISLLFQTANLGISRADYKYLGKSGSSMAMLEHGLPLLIRGNRPNEYLNIFLQQFNNQLLYCSDSTYSLPPKGHHNNRQKEIAQQFISIINKHNIA